MNAQNKTTSKAGGPALHKMQTSELAGITGGTIWVSDGYCVSPLLPRHLPLVAVQIQEFNGAIATGSH